MFEGEGHEVLGDLMAQQVRADKPEAEDKDLDKVRAKALRATIPTPTRSNMPTQLNGIFRTWMRVGHDDYGELPVIWGDW